MSDQTKEAKEALSRRALLRMIGNAAGSSAMYGAMTSMGLAQESGFKGQPKLGKSRSGDSVLVLEVDDDGDGFDEPAPSAGGIGLRVMRYRARLIGGILEIGSAPAGGARISCRVKLSV